MLPHSVRAQIGLAYLLARATDTVADTELIPVVDRLRALDELRARILGQRSIPVDFGRLAASQPSGTEKRERLLLERLEEAIGRLTELGRRIGPMFGRSSKRSQEARFLTWNASGIHQRDFGLWRRVKTWRIIPTGWPDASESFGPGSPVATVFRRLLSTRLRFAWTELRLGKGCTRTFCGPAPGSPVGTLLSSRADLAQFGMKPESCWTRRMNPARPLYDDWCLRALDHLAAGWRYTNGLPKSQWRLRLACAWPVLLGVRTLEKLRAGGVLDPSRRIKVSGRRFVRSLLDPSCAFRFVEPGNGRFPYSRGNHWRVLRSAIQ